jgi:hypothetical protein
MNTTDFGAAKLTLFLLEAFAGDIGAAAATFFAIGAATACVASGRYR